MSLPVTERGPVCRYLRPLDSEVEGNRGVRFRVYTLNTETEHLLLSSFKYASRVLSGPFLRPNSPLHPLSLCGVCAQGQVFYPHSLGAPTAVPDPVGLTTGSRQTLPFSSVRTSLRWVCTPHSYRTRPGPKSPGENPKVGGSSTHNEIDPEPTDSSLPESRPQRGREGAHVGYLLSPKYLWNLQRGPSTVRESRNVSLLRREDLPLRLRMSCYQSGRKRHPLLPFSQGCPLRVSNLGGSGRSTELWSVPLSRRSVRDCPETRRGLPVPLFPWNQGPSLPPWLRVSHCDPTPLTL